MFPRSGNPLLIFLQSYVPCLSYLENLGQFPIQGYLKCTDNCLFFGFSQFLLLLMTFLLSYDVWVTSIIQVNFRFERYWWFCVMNFWNFHTIRVFEVRKSIAGISTELLCLGNLENPGKLPVVDVLGGTTRLRDRLFIRSFNLKV